MQTGMKDRQFISLVDLKEMGYSQYRVNQMVHENRLKRVNRRYYENLEYEGDFNDFYAVPAVIESGVVCLLSAAVHYELSTHRPLAVEVAIPRKSRIPDSPDWPRVRYYLFSGPRYSLGIERIREAGNTYLIYDMEKTVCDIVLYRKKLGLEPAIEVVKTYLSRKDRDIPKLMRYAEALRVKTAMKQYLEVLV